MNSPFFIAAGVDKDNKHYWIKNLDPIIWCNDKSDCKKWLTYNEVRSEILRDEESFRSIFNTSNMMMVLVYEVNEDYNIFSIADILNKDN